jgi:hypothetical protein
MIYAKKSYLFEPLPFIPEIFRLKEEDMLLNTNCHISVVENEEHGHCDLLNPFYSKMIRETKLVGCSMDESMHSIWKYYHWITNEIKELHK